MANAWLFGLQRMAEMVGAARGTRRVPWGSHPPPSGGTGSRPAESKPAGHRIAGEGFYVWDEDPRRALDWARELAGPRATRSREG